MRNRNTYTNYKLIRIKQIYFKQDTRFNVLHVMFINYNLPKTLTITFQDNKLNSRI